MKHSFKRITNCRACGSDNLRGYLSLPSSPLANELVPPSKTLPSERFEVMMMVCEDCFLSQLSIVVDAAKLYQGYLYRSSISGTFRTHCRNMARDIKNSFVFKNDPPRLLDIASNDGCLMREFAAEGFEVMGFEPCSEAASEARHENLPTICEFFGANSKTDRSYDVITATNVFGHVDDLNGFLQGVKNCLEPEKGVFAVEVPHMLSTLDQNQYDTIYHEHLTYFLLTPMINLFKRNGLEIFGVDHVDIHGGSIRVYAGTPGAREIEETVDFCLNDEQAGHMFDIQTYKEFAHWTVRHGQDLRTILDFTRRADKKVMGYGAAAKAVSLLNYLGIGQYIHSIVDETPGKLGMKTPGENVPIVGFDQFAAQKPDYIILFAWNFAEELVAKTRHLGAKYILPMPVPKLLTAEAFAPKEAA